MASKDKTSDVKEYRYGAKRTNNPPAGLASHVEEEHAEKLHYRYDPHLPPRLRFDQTGGADQLPKDLIELLQKTTTGTLTDEEAQVIVDALRRRQQPWLEWTGKRQKHDVEVNPVSLHTHERVSTQALVKMLEKEDVQRDLFADPQLPYHQAVQFYKHDVDWTNRLILGDSLEVMASLSHREGLAGQVQMIYLDPPYGINYKSNFQPTVGQNNYRETYTNLTREPEMVKAYRDTWRLGVHTYLDYLRDRLVVARELLKGTGSIFVQIGEENVHFVRNLLDEVFGKDNFISQITFQTTSGFPTRTLASVGDFLLWYARDAEHVKVNKLYRHQRIVPGTGNARWLVLPNRDYRGVTKAEARGEVSLPEGASLYNPGDLKSQGGASEPQPFQFQGEKYEPGSTSHWKANYPEGMDRLAFADRIHVAKNSIRYKRFATDFPFAERGNIWTDTITGNFTADKIYVVQTNTKVIERCLLMTSDPGDLIMDPTCGSGTTAYVAERQGRRWITIDTSRVAVALTRQRLLTSTFPHFRVRGSGENEVQDPARGFVYKTVPHIMLKKIANNTALDKLKEKYQPILDKLLEAANVALSEAVTDDLREQLRAKLIAKKKEEGKRAVTSADERKWLLPEEGEAWKHCEVPFDIDDDWPEQLLKAVTAYRTKWRAKMDEVDAAVAEGSEHETLYDQPEIVKGVTRVSGPFTVDAVMPPEQSLSDEVSPIGGAPRPSDAAFETGRKTNGDTGTKNADSYLDKMTRLMEKDGVRFMDNKELAFDRLDRIEGGTYLHAEGVWNGGEGEERVAVSFGPEHGSITGRQVEYAMREAFRRSFDALVFAGFNFDDAAQVAIQETDGNVIFHMAHIRPDVVMEDLLYRPQTEQLFTVFGMPRTSLRKTDEDKYQVEMQGVDVYDPVKGQINATKASKVAAWFVDTDYDGRTFCISQAFFPRKATWKKLQRALRGQIDKEQFDQLSSTTSLQFVAGEHSRAAIKVIDPRGNEVMRVHELS